MCMHNCANVEEELITANDAQIEDDLNKVSINTS